MTLTQTDRIFLFIYFCWILKLRSSDSNCLKVKIVCFPGLQLKKWAPVTKNQLPYCVITHAVSRHYGGTEWVAT